MRNWSNKLNIFAKIEKYIGEKNANKLRKVRRLFLSSCGRKEALFLAAVEGRKGFS